MALARSAEERLKEEDIIKKRSDKAEGRGQEASATALEGEEVRGKEWVEGSVFSSLNPFQVGNLNPKP